MNFNEERELLRYLSNNVSLNKGEFPKGLTFDNINSQIADYINHYYTIDVELNNCEWNSAKLKTTQHNEKIYLQTPYRLARWFENSYFMPLREFVFDYKERAIEDIMEENNLFEDRYYKMLENETLDEELDLQEAYEFYLIEKFSNEYLDYLNENGGINILIEPKKEIKSEWKNYFSEVVIS